MKPCFAILSIALVAVPHHAIAVPAETCKDQWMTQNIDHFGKHNGTFQQRYTINTDFYAPGGPILLFQGEETDVLDCPKSTILYEWARELGGLTVSLEHRYFGPSKPFGNSSTSNENFRFLTLDNVMADAVAFVQQVKRNITGADKSKVLVASGSYGGFLAAAFRMNHAESFDAALASAGPVVGFGDGDDPDSYNWYNWLNRLYLTHSLEASANIEKAFTHLSQRLVNNDTESLQRDLRLCTPIVPGNATQAVALEGLLQLVFSLAAEFNYPRAIPGRSPIAYPFFEILKIATNATDPIKLLASANWMWYEPLGAVCLDHEHPADFVKAAAVPLINYTVFDYITCTYLPYHASAFTANTTIFPPRTLDTNAVRTACEAIYGVPTLTKAELEARYHLSPREIQDSTHIIFSLGEYDPTSGTEPAALPLSADRHASRSLYAADVAHREDLLRTRKGDGEGVGILRRTELGVIKTWFGSDGGKEY